MIVLWLEQKLSGRYAALPLDILSLHQRRPPHVRRDAAAREEWNVCTRGGNRLHSRRDESARAEGQVCTREGTSLHGRWDESARAEGRVCQRSCGHSADGSSEVWLRMLHNSVLNSVAKVRIVHIDVSKLAAEVPWGAARAWVKRQLGGTILFGEGGGCGRLSHESGRVVHARRVRWRKVYER